MFTSRICHSVKRSYCSPARQANSSCPYARQAQRLSPIFHAKIDQILMGDARLFPLKKDSDIYTHADFLAQKIFYDSEYFVYYYVPNNGKTIPIERFQHIASQCKEAYLAKELAELIQIELVAREKGTQQDQSFWSDINTDHLKSIRDKLLLSAKRNEEYITPQIANVIFAKKYGSFFAFCILTVLFVIWRDNK